MKTYKFEIVTQVLEVKASSQEEAEAKYDSYFAEEACPCGAHMYDCDCVESSEETYHFASLLEEAN